MRMLLINQNPVVSKLAELSAKKSGVEIVEKPSLEAVEEEVNHEEFDLLVIDDEILNDEDASTLKRIGGAKVVGLIYSSDESKVPGFDYYLKKPFLPTEMVDMLNDIKEELLLPQTEEAEETKEKKEGDEISSEAGEEDFSDLLEDFEDIEPLEEVQEAKSVQEDQESTNEEDFDALLQSLEMEETEAFSKEEDSEESETSSQKEEEAMAETIEEEQEEESVPEPETLEISKESDSGEENFDELLADLDGDEADIGDTDKIDSAEAKNLPEPEEDFDALLQSLEMEETEAFSKEEDSKESETSSQKEEETMAETIEEEQEKEREKESVPEPETLEISKESDSGEENFDELLADLDGDEVDVEAEDEDLGLPAVEEEVSGVLDENMVSEVKELLDDEGNTKESATLENPEEKEVALPQAEEESQEGETLKEDSEEEEIEFDEESPSVEAPFMEEEQQQGEIAQSSETEEKNDMAEVDELAQIDEAELGALLGEEIGDDLGSSEEPSEIETSPVGTSEAAAHSEPVKGDGSEAELVAQMLKMGPEALRKLLAGAQITINITFPKED